MFAEIETATETNAHPFTSLAVIQAMIRVLVKNVSSSRFHFICLILLDYKNISKSSPAFFSPLARANSSRLSLRFTNIGNHLSLHRRRHLPPFSLSLSRSRHDGGNAPHSSIRILSIAFSSLLKIQSPPPTLWFCRFLTSEFLLLLLLLLTERLLARYCSRERFERTGKSPVRVHASFFLRSCSTSQSNCEA